jgi:hypothetical protein
MVSVKPFQITLKNDIITSLMASHAEGRWQW